MKMCNIFIRNILSLILPIFFALQGNAQQEKMLMLTDWTAKTIYDLEVAKKSARDSFLIAQITKRELFVMNQNSESSFRFKSMALFNRIGLKCIAFAFEEFLSGEEFSYNLYILTKSDSLLAYSYDDDLLLRKKIKIDRSISINEEDSEILFMEDRFIILTKFKNEGIRVNSKYFNKNGNFDKIKEMAQ